MKRIIILRHGEKPDRHEYKDIESHLGLVNQGAVRAFLMPKLIKKLIGDEKYNFYTYTDSVSNIPTCRAFYTGQLLENRNDNFNKSSQTGELVNAISNDPSNTIIVCWEHDVIPDIIKQLINQDIDFKTVCKQVQKNKGEKRSEVTVSLDQLDGIKYCSDDYLKENKKARNYVIDKNDDVAYSLVFDINGSNLNVYLGMLVVADGDNFRAKFYV